MNLQRKTLIALGTVGAVVGISYWVGGPVVQTAGEVTQNLQSHAEVPVLIATAAPAAHAPDKAEDATLPRPSLAQRQRSEPAAGAVRVPAALPDAPQGVKAFREWAASYFLAEPEERAALLEQGAQLAQAQRAAISQLISSQPLSAIENAVPMVVRQDLPPQIVAQLEERVSARGELAVLGAAPAAGQAHVPASYIRTFRPEGGRGQHYSAYVYGQRANLQSYKSTRVSGVAVDGQLAVLESRVRRLEVGERPDMSKRVEEACPISGIVTELSEQEKKELPPMAEHVVAAEDDETVRFFCMGGHIQSYSDQITAEEQQSHWASLGVAAEGSTGGGAYPLNPPPGFTTGPQKLLYIRIAFPDVLEDPQSEASCYDSLRQVTDFFMANSFGRLYISPTVAPLVVVPYPESYYTAATRAGGVGGEFILRDHALEVARRMGYDTAEYDLDVVEYNGGPGNFGGLGYVGGKGVWMKTSNVGVLAHELGHNLGLGHSNFWMSNPASYTGPGANIEYGNFFDVMGGATSMGHYVAPHKAILGWLQPDAYHRVFANGTYRIHQVDQGQADSDKRYAIAVKRDAERDYWLEFRQGHPAIPSLFSGLMVTWDPWGSQDTNASTSGSNGGAQLVDMTPGSGSMADTRNDSGLPIGRTYSDPEIDLHITPIIKSATTPPYMDVVVNKGPFVGNVAPTLSAISGNLTPALGGSTTLAVSGADANGDVLAYSWDFGDGTTSLDNSRSQVKSWSNAGEYFVTCTVSDMKGLSYTRSALVTVGFPSPSEYTVTGYIRDGGSSPAAGVYVANRPLTNTTGQANPANFRYAYTDSSGFYALTRMPQTTGTNTYTVSAQQYPKAFSPLSPNQFSLISDLTGKDWETLGNIPGLPLVVEDGSATEAAGATRTAVITFTRSTTSGTFDLQLFATQDGTARPTTDYTLSAVAQVAPYTVNGPAITIGPVQAGGRYGLRIPANYDRARITLTPVSDAASEGEEYAVLTFPDTLPGGFRLDGPSRVVIPIADDDGPTLPVVSLVAEDSLAGEAGDPAAIKLTRNGSTTAALNVLMGYNGADAVSGTDFTAPSSITIPAGQDSIIVPLAILNDLDDEGTERIGVSISANAAYARATNQSTATIYISDNDQALLTVTASDAAATEAAGNTGKFTIRRTAVDIDEDLTVQFSLGGSALIGTDYRRIDGVAVIPAQEDSVDILIEPYEDSIDEADQTVILRLATNDRYAIAPPGVATVTITDNDASQFSIQSMLANVNEPANGSANTVLFTVSRPASGSAASLTYTVTGTATAGVDYDRLSGSLTFSSSDLSRTIPVIIQSDSLNENAETITLTLTGGNAGFEKTATAYILDEDLRPFIDVSVDDTSAGLSNFVEPAGVGTSTLRFRVTRTGGSTSSTLNVPFNLAGTSSSGADYTLVTGSGVTTGTTSTGVITIAAGQVGGWVSLTLQGDAVAEGTETIVLSVPASGTYGLRTSSSTAFISDNDSYTGAPAPSVAFQTASSTIVEKTGLVGTTLQIPVVLNAAQAGPVVISYRVSDGEATGRGVDYTFTPGTLTFAAGEMSKNITLTTTPDSFPEGNESVDIELFSNIGANIGANSTHSVTIQDLAPPEVLTDTVSGNPHLNVTLRGRVYPNLPGSAVGNIITITSPGAGYATAPTVNFSGGGGTGAAAVAIVSGGEVTGITVTAAGSGYTSTPTVTLTGGGFTTQATATAALASGTRSWFEWGTTATALSNATTQQDSGAGAGPFTLNAPFPPTGSMTYPGTYYYRAVVQSPQGTVRGITRQIRTIATPVVITLNDAGHTVSSITLAGTVNPNRANANVWFEYGPTTSYGSTTPVQQVPNATTTLSITSPLTGLVENTIVHYRFVVQSALGTFRGSDRVALATSAKTAGDLLVYLDSRDPTAGTAAWSNLGSLLGSFTETGSPSYVASVHESSFPGVLFNGITDYYSGPVAPVDVTGNDSRSLEAWVFNPGFSTPDTVLALGRDGVLSQTALTYGNTTQARGAVAHGNVPADNVAYTAATLPAPGLWHHLAYTYDGTTRTARLYVNGVLKVTKVLSAVMTGLSDMTVGAMLDSAGVAKEHFHGYLNSARIHGGILAATDVSFNYALGPNAHAPAAPIVAVRGVSALTASSAVLTGQVNASGLASSAWFEWGTSSSFDNASAPVVVPAGRAVTALSLPVTGLAAGQVYYYRLVAQNSSGTTQGQTRSFIPSSYANAGVIHVDLRAEHFTGGASWVNHGGLGDFLSIGSPTAFSANAGSTGLPGVELNGSSHAFASAEMPALDVTFGSDRTLEIWALNPSLDQPDETLITLGRTAAARTGLELRHGSVTGVQDGADNQPWATVPSAGSWHHFVLTFDGSVRKVYVDGREQLSQTTTAGANTWNDPILLGAARSLSATLTFAQNGFSGFINTLRVHGGVLTPAQISANAAAGPQRLPVATGVAPTVTTGGSSLVTTASATLAGSALPGGLATTAWIEWGLTSGALNQVTPAQLLGDSFSTQSFSGAVGGLTSGSTYFYRAAAENSQGTVYGAELSFVATGSVAGLPAVATSAATSVLIKSATLNGSTTSGGQATQAWFEHGRTTALGSATAKVSITAATANKVMTAPLIGLSPHSAYFFRLVAENASGRAVGAVQTFTTGNTAPTATVGTLLAKENLPTALLLKGADADGEPLIFAITTPPNFGSISGSPPNLIYTSNAGSYTGPDSLQFTVSDGVATSAPATISITISSNNDAPVATNLSVSGSEDAASISGTLAGTDEEGDAITAVTIVSQPSSGTLTLTGSPLGAFTYRPDSDFNGADSFTFTVTAGGKVSAPGLCSITVSPLNDEPVALTTYASSATVAVVSSTAQGLDLDGDSLTFIKLTDPASGTVVWNASTGAFTYTPTGAVAVSDSFTFKVNDGLLDSEEATIHVNLGGPTISDETFTGVADDLLEEDLADAGTPGFEFNVLQFPEHGSVFLTTEGTLYYNPIPGFIGTDSFTYSVFDGTASSNEATVTLIITARPPDWTWIAGANVAKAGPVLGTQNLASPGNTPSARTEPAQAVGSNGDLWVFGGYGQDSANKTGLLADLWMRSSSTGHWLWRRGSSLVQAAAVYGAQGVAAGTNSPGARQGSVAWAGVDGRFYVFGGSGRDSSATSTGLLNDLWRYDPVLDQWTWLKGSNALNANGTYGSKGVAGSTMTPGARQGAVGWVDASGRLWLFGGNGRAASGSIAGLLNDLWCYEPSGNKWSWMGGGSTLLVNGVYGTQGIPAGSNAPGSRSHAAAWVDKDGDFWLFGGTGRPATGTVAGSLSDLWRYSITTGAWTWIRGASTVNAAGIYGVLGSESPTSQPGARAGAAAWGDAHGLLYLFGGQGTGYFNDVWRFDPEAQSWTWLKGPSTANGVATYGTKGVPAPNNTPGARRGSIAFLDAAQDFHLFGGANGANTYNDTWRIASDGAPQVTAPTVTNITSTDADFEVQVDTQGQEVTATFYYRQMNQTDWTMLSSQSVNSSTPMAVSTAVTGLNSGSLYLMQVELQSTLPNVYSQPVMFSTLGVNPPLDAEFVEVTDIADESSPAYAVAITLNAPADEAFTVPYTVAGTAVAGSDYVALPMQVSFVPGQSVAYVYVDLLEDIAEESDETLILTLDTPSAVAVGLGAQDTFTLDITDNEEAPAITLPPVSGFHAIGSALTLNVTTTGMGNTFQWKKNNVNLAGATREDLSIASVKTTDAGKYKLEVKNPAGIVTSTEVEVFVYDATGKSNTVAANGQVVWTVAVTPPIGSTVSYIWKQGISPAGTALTETANLILGTQTKTLTLKSLQGPASGTYYCTLQKTGDAGLTADSGVFSLNVPTSVPSITTPAGALPEAVVNVPYSFQVQVDSTRTMAPTSFTATGLPTGLTINASGIISGKATATVVNKAFTVRATNSVGSSIDLNCTITVLGLPANGLGKFIALDAPSAENNGLGARLDVTTTAAGTYTGKFTMRGVAATLGGPLNITVVSGAVSTVGGSATILRTGLAPLSLAFSISATTGDISVNFTQPGVGSSSYSGYRQVWKLTAPDQAVDYRGDYTFLSEPDAPFVGALDVPQGASIGSFKVADDGAFSAAITTAEGLKLTCASFVGATGQTALFTLYPGTVQGSYYAEASITTAGTAPNLENVMDAAVQLIRLPATTGTSYKAGYDFSATLNGGLYAPPAAGGRIMALPAGSNNAELYFSEGGLPADSSASVLMTVSNTGTGIVQTIAMPTAHPWKPTFTVDAAKGTFKGTLILPNAIVALQRRVSYEGVIVRRGSTYAAGGYLTVPQLPQPGQTLTTSPVLSALVELIEVVP